MTGELQQRYCRRHERHGAQVHAQLLVRLVSADGTPEPSKQYPLCADCYRDLCSETPGMADLGLTWEATPIQQREVQP